MAFRHPALTLLGGVSVALTVAAAAAIGQDAPIALSSARVSIAGTSNIHAYTAATTAVRVTRIEVDAAAAGPALWDAVVTPGVLKAFEVAIPAATLSSPKDGLDKNMHKALKVKEHPDIVFRLTRLEPRPDVPNGVTAIGVLRIAGVEREVALALTTQRKETGLSVTGEVQLLMTDFGITPPKAMLGMLRTDPKVTVRVETVLAIPLT